MGETVDAVCQQQNTDAVFVTYTKENNRYHYRYIRQLVENLRSKGIKVYLDGTDDRIRGMSVSDWIETKITECQHIIVCISENYKTTISLEDDNDETIHDATSRLHATYIYRRILSRYIQNGSLNYRVIPVVFPNCRNDYIPNWLHDTIIYDFSETNRIANRIKKKANEWPSSFEN